MTVTILVYLQIIESTLSFRQTVSTCLQLCALLSLGINLSQKFPALKDPSGVFRESCFGDLCLLITGVKTVKVQYIQIVIKGSIRPPAK